MAKLMLGTREVTPAIYNGGATTTLSATPTTNAQNFTPTLPYVGYSSVSIAAVTSTIDANITAGNIKKDVTILGVTGTLEGGGSVSAPIFDANYFVGTNGSITNLIRFRDPGSGIRTYFLKPFAKSLGNGATVHNWLDSGLNEVNDSFTGITSIVAVGCFASGKLGSVEVTLDTTTEFISFRALEEAIISTAKSFQFLTSLKKVDLHNAKKVVLIGAFSGLSNFQEIDLTSVEDLTTPRALGGTASTGGAFANTSVSTLSFPSLKSTSFGSYTNQFAYMLKGVTGCTVHFPSNLQSVIGSWSDVTSGFGGTNTIVLFDLPATT